MHLQKTKRTEYVKTRKPVKIEKKNKFEKIKKKKMNTRKTDINRSL